MHLVARRPAAAQPEDSTPYVLAEVLAHARKMLVDCGRCPYCFAHIRAFVPPERENGAEVARLWLANVNPRTGHSTSCERQDVRL